MAVQQSLRWGQSAAARWISRGAMVALVAILIAVATRDTVLDQMFDALGAPLERRFERYPLANPADVTGLLVLGGGEERLQEAGRLARLHPHFKLHVSGAGEPDFVWSLLGGGIAPARVSIETISRSTFENAVNSRLFIDPKPGERWLLVTSAVHMPRSMGAFRKLGFSPEPWPVDDGTGRALEPVAREWMGLLWYWVSGRGSALFPSPLQ